MISSSILEFCTSLVPSCTLTHNNGWSINTCPWLSTRTRRMVLVTHILHLSSQPLTALFFPSVLVQRVALLPEFQARNRKNVWGRKYIIEQSTGLGISPNHSVTWPWISWLTSLGNECSYLSNERVGLDEWFSNCAQKEGRRGSIWTGVTSLASRRIVSLKPALHIKYIRFCLNKGTWGSMKFEDHWIRSNS